MYISAHTTYAIRLSVIVSLGGFVFGYDAAVISGAIGFIGAEFALTDWQTGFLVAAPSLSGMVAIAAGPVSDLIGRKKILIIIAALYMLSAIFSAIAPSYHTLMLARILGGLAFASLALAPIYICEIAPAEMRGRLISINQLNIVIGFSMAYVANNSFQKVAGSGASWAQDLMIDSHTWRWMLGAEILPAFVFLMLLFTVPESPRWLLLKKKHDDARRVLDRLIEQGLVQQHIDSINNSFSNHEPFPDRLRAVFSRRLRLVLLAGITVGVAQQITGVNAIYFYAPTIFQQSGVGTDAAFTQALWIGITNIVFTLIAIATIDRLGRKPLLIAGLFGVFVSMAVCAYGFSQAEYGLTAESIATLSEQVDRQALMPLVNQNFATDVELKEALKLALGLQAYNQTQGELLQAAVSLNSTLVLFGILGFVGSFAFSLGPVMWVLLPEIFSNQLRGVGMAVVGVCNSGVSYVIQAIFPWELSTLGATLTFSIYSFLALLFLFLVAKLLPETKGKSLEQLEKELIGQ